MSDGKHCKVSMEAMLSIKEQLSIKNKTISVAESLTSGNLQAMICSISGASTFFEGGVTAYSIKQKAKLLLVDQKKAEECNAVSEYVASAMAEGVVKLFGSDYGIATTGYAEPNKELNISHPYAYVCYFLPNKKIIEQIEDQNSLSRQEFQHYLTEEIIIRFSKHIQRYE